MGLVSKDIHIVISNSICPEHVLPEAKYDNILMFGAISILFSLELEVLTYTSILVQMEPLRKGKTLTRLFNLVYYTHASSFEGLWVQPNRGNRSLCAAQ